MGNSKGIVRLIRSSSINFFPWRVSDFSSGDELKIDPLSHTVSEHNHCEVRSQDGVELQMIPLIADDPEALAALTTLRTKGYTSDQVKEAFEELEPVLITKLRQRQAMRIGLDMRIRTEAARILRERGMNPEGHDLDHRRLGQSNFVVLTSTIHRLVNSSVGCKIR